MPLLLSIMFKSWAPSRQTISKHQSSCQSQPPPSIISPGSYDSKYHLLQIKMKSYLPIFWEKWMRVTDLGEDGGCWEEVFSDSASSVSLVFFIWSCSAFVYYRSLVYSLSLILATTYTLFICMFMIYTDCIEVIERSSWNKFTVIPIAQEFTRNSFIWTFNYSGSQYSLTHSYQYS